MKDLSVVIVNYRTSNLLANLLESLNRELKDIDSEVVVVDNSCSLSEKANLKKLRCTYSWVRFIINRFNLGYAGACNVGLENTTGRYVLFMNPDVVPTKGSIRVLWEHMIESKAAVMVPKLFLDEECRVLHPPAYPFKPSVMLFHRLFQKLFFMWWRKYSCRLWNAADDIPVRFITGAVFMVDRRDAVFDTDLPLYFEDAALSLIMERKGKKVLFCPHSVMVHFYDLAPSECKSKLWEISERIYFGKYFSRLSVNLLKALAVFYSHWFHPGSKKLRDILKEGDSLCAVSPHPDFVPFALGTVSLNSRFADRFGESYAFEWSSADLS